MARDRSSERRRVAAVRSFRFQASALLIGAVIVPALLRHPGYVSNIFSLPETFNVMVTVTLAILVGVFVLRRVSAFPGTKAFGYILPSFAIPYGLALAFLLAFRINYSSIYLGMSFAAALGIAFFTNLWIERNVVFRFHVAPFGRALAMTEIAAAEWLFLAQPKVPETPFEGIVADLNYNHSYEWEHMLAQAALAGCPVYHVKDLRESLTGQVTMEHISENSFGSLLPNLAYHKSKRLLDFLLCVVAIPLVVPLMVLIALAIRIDSPGPVLFRQERRGYRGRVFTMIKFRTMTPRPSVSDTEEARADAMTAVDDNRITRVGALLRRTRLDELPQFFNVLVGQMSLIGPRPEADPLSRWYEEELPFYVYRHIVRPGMTGWAQVHQGHVTDLKSVHQKLSYDFYYIKNYSAWLDILIALRTFRVMASGFGAK